MQIIPDRIDPAAFMNAAKRRARNMGNAGRLELLEEAKLVVAPLKYVGGASPETQDHQGSWQPFPVTMFACLDIVGDDHSPRGLAALFTETSDDPKEISLAKASLIARTGAMRHSPVPVTFFGSDGTEIEPFVPVEKMTPEKSARVLEHIESAQHILRSANYMIFPGNDGHLVPYMISNTFMIAKKGREWLPDMFSLVEGKTEDEIERFTSITNACLSVAFATMDLLACKNVALADNEEVVSRQRRRHGYAGIKWKTIVVTGRSQVVHKAGAKGVNIADLPALHECRGHFKEYTGERPLFGKVSGKFFWHPHLRGRAENGIILHDKYEVKG